MGAHDHRAELSHGTTAAGRHTAPLVGALALTGGFLVVEVVGAFWTGSLALLADAGHMLTDVGGLSLSLLAISFAERPPTPVNTYGYLRTEILADPLIGAAVGVWILPRTWSLIRQAVQILMEGVPPHLDIQEIQTAMMTVRGVVAVHDLHVLTLTSGKDAMSGHVVVKTLSAGGEILGELHRLLHEHFGIEHTTIQLEAETLVQLARQTADPSSTDDDNRSAPPSSGTP